MQTWPRVSKSGLSESIALTAFLRSEWKPDCGDCSGVRRQDTRIHPHHQPRDGGPAGIDPGSGRLVGGGGFVATYSADGVPCWASLVETNSAEPGATSVLGVIRTSEDALRAYGGFDGTVDLGGGPLSSPPGGGIGYVLGFGD